MVEAANRYTFAVGLRRLEGELAETKSHRNMALSEGWSDEISHILVFLSMQMDLEQDDDVFYTNEEVLKWIRLVDALNFKIKIHDIKFRNDWIESMNAIEAYLYREKVK